VQIGCVVVSRAAEDDLRGAVIAAEHNDGPVQVLAHLRGAVGAAADEGF